MSKTVQDIDFDAFINIDLNRAQKTVQRKFLREVLQPEGLSVQEWRALLNLRRYGPCHLRALARYSLQDATPMGRALHALEARGFVRADADESDARRRLLSVTAEGEAKFAQLWPQALAFSRAIRDRLGSEGFDALQAALKSIQGLDGDPEPLDMAAE